MASVLNKHRRQRLNRDRRRRRVAPVRPKVEVLEPRLVLAAWIPQGPAPVINSQVENIEPDNQVAGAIHTVLAHPTNANELYIGAVNGGIWKTTNAQAVRPTWTPLTDELPSLSIGALAYDPTDSSRQTVVAGGSRERHLHRGIGKRRRAIGPCRDHRRRVAWRCRSIAGHECDPILGGGRRRRDRRLAGEHRRPAAEHQHAHLRRPDAAAAGAGRPYGG